MAKTWEDVEWDSDSPLKEWVIEYSVKEGTSVTYHVTIVTADGHESVQKNLLKELEETYAGGQPIEVTVHRMEEVHNGNSSVSFEGMFSP
jgi:hypothetical protein